MPRHRRLVAMACWLAAVVLLHLPVVITICGRDIMSAAPIFALGSNLCCAAGVWTTSVGRRTFIRWLLLAVAALTGVAGMLLVLAVHIVRKWIREFRAAPRTPA